MARLMTDDERMTLAGLRPKFVHPAIGAAADAAAALRQPSFRTYLRLSTSVAALVKGASQ
jgi:hypothetical protein